MAAQNPTANTEEIIDLTELIERGSVPEDGQEATAAPAPHDRAEDDLQAHMRGLNDASLPAEAAIDDLLAQMETHESAIPSVAAGGPEPDHPVDPNEKLDMPGLGDVDHLLQSLDLPPQPREETDGDSASASGADAGSQDLDSLLAVDAMLDSLHAAGADAAPQGAAQAAPEPPVGAGQPPAAKPEAAPLSDMPDLDDLLAAGAKEEAPLDPGDLAALLAEAQPEAAAVGTPSRTSAQSAPARPADTAPPTAHAADATTAATPSPGRAAPASAATISADELADLLAAAADDVAAAPEPPAAQSPQPVAEAAPGAAPAPSSAAPVPPAGATPDLTADLDALLAEATAHLDADPTDRKSVV